MFPFPKDTLLQEVLASLDFPNDEKEQLSQDEIESLYSYAFSLYEAARYKQAEALFTKLVLSSPFEPRFWRGLASSRQLNQNYKEALHAWCLVCLLEEKDASSHFHAAECMISLGEKEEAMKALIVAEGLLNKEDDSLKKQIAVLKELHHA